jgi:hypothetical protein
MLRLDNTLVLLMLMSEGTHLLNFAVDKKYCSAYMTNGNLSSNIRQMPSLYSITMIAVVPIPIWTSVNPPKWLHEQGQTN